MSCNEFYNLIETPTRFENSKISLLDHNFINSFHNDIFSCNVDTNLISNHLPVIGCIAHTNVTTPKPIQAVIKLHHCKLYEKISDPKNWEGVLQSTDPDEAFSLFTKTTQALIAESSNKKTIKRSKKRSFHKPWMTNEINTLIQKREKYYDCLVMNILTVKFKSNLVNFEMWLRTRLRKPKLNYIKINLKL